MFYKKDDEGNPIRRRVVVDCSEDEVIVEQSHKDEVNINNIIKRHGIDLVAKTNNLRSSDYTFDDIPGNDFQEAMLKVIKAQDTFMTIPSAIRKKFNNNPAEFLDFVQNPENMDEMVNLGLATRKAPEQPIEVVVTNPETPPTDTVT